MQKGVAWFGVSEDDSGQVIVRSDGGKKVLMPAIEYVVNGIEPPIYNLPKREKGCGSRHN